MQYSPLLPPVGVWAVSQSQCGRPPSQAGYWSSPWWAVTPPTSYSDAGPSHTEKLFTLYHAVLCAYAVLAAVSSCYPPVWGRLPTRYSPVRHSVTFVPKNSGASFDLHVLGTPPAFILSQDQTLMLKVCIRSQDLLVLKLPFTVNFGLVLCWTMFFEYSLKNFQGFMLLFSYQCPFRCLSDNFYILSNSFVFVKNFFIYFLKLFFSASCCFHNVWYSIMFSTICQELFQSFLSPFCRLSFVRSSNIDYFIISRCVCQQLFYFYFSQFHRSSNHLILSNKITEKEGFEPSRRANDLHP